MSALEKPTTWSEDPARKSGPAVLQGCGPGDGRRVPDRPRGCAHRAGTGRRSEQQDGGPRGHARAEARARGLGAGDTGAGARGGRGGGDLCSLQVLACALGVWGDSTGPDCSPAGNGARAWAELVVAQVRGPDGRARPLSGTGPRRGTCPSTAELRGAGREAPSL